MSRQATCTYAIDLEHDHVNPVEVHNGQKVWGVGRNLPCQGCIYV